MLALFLLFAAAPAQGVLCIAPMPSAEAYRSAAKGASTPDLFEDTPEAGQARIAAARKAKPIFYAIGAIVSGPVTDKQAQCIDGIALDENASLRRDGKPFMKLRIPAATPVMWLRYDPFYDNYRVDAVPEHLWCPKRDAQPNCGFCPCRKWIYTAPTQPALAPASAPN